MAASSWTNRLDDKVGLRHLTADLELIGEAFKFEANGSKQPKLVSPYLFYLYIRKTLAVGSIRSIDLPKGVDDPICGHPQSGH